MYNKIVSRLSRAIRALNINEILFVILKKIDSISMFWNWFHRPPKKGPLLLWKALNKKPLRESFPKIRSVVKVSKCPNQIALALVSMLLPIFVCYTRSDFSFKALAFYLHFDQTWIPFAFESLWLISHPILKGVFWNSHARLVTAYGRELESNAPKILKNPH